MGVYSINEFANLSASIDWDAVEEFAGEPNLDGACELIIESETNFSNFMKAIGISELQFMEENGTEMIYEEGRFKSYIDKAIGFFKSILAKIQTIIKKFMVKVESIIMTNDAFVKKYSDTLGSLKADVEVNGYVFTNLGAREYTVKEKLAASAKDAKDIQRDVLGAKVGDNFSEDIFKHFHNGETSKKTIKVSNFSDQVSIIKSTKDLKTKAKESYKKAEKMIKDIIKNLEKFKKEANKADASTTGNETIVETNKTIANYKVMAHAMTAVNTAYLSALRSQNSQARAICAKGLQTTFAKSTKEEIKKEGFDHFDDFLGNVEFN